MGEGGLRPPTDVVQFLQFLVVHQASTHVPDSYSIVNSQTWACDCGEDVLAVWTPLAHTSVASLDCADLVVILLEVIYIHLPD